MGYFGTTWLTAAPVIQIACLALLTSSVSAIEIGEFSAAKLQGDGWVATNVSMDLEVTENNGLAGKLGAATIRFPEFQIELLDVKVSCAQILMSTSMLDCADARISVRGLPIDAERFSASFKFDMDTGAILLQLPALKIAGGKASVRFQSGADGWQSQISVQDADLTKLKTAISRWFAMPLPEGVDGKLAMRVRLSGGETVEAATGTAQLFEVSGSNTAGTLASEKLGLEFGFNAQLSESAWMIDLELRKTEGQVYALPVFVDFANHPLQGIIAITVPETGDWPASFTASQSGVGRFSGELALNPVSGALQRLALTSAHAELPGAYDVYLQPFLVGTTADNLETAGAMDISASYSDESLRTLKINLDEIYLDDRRGRFALYGLEGDVDWRHDSIGRTGLDWQGGYLYKLGLGKASLYLDTGNGAITLAEATTIPVLDGRLKVSRFGLNHVGTELRELEFEADIEAIGLRALSRALGWPPFSGTLSGRIPRMRLADNAITVAGAMNAEVFDGLITIDNLRISEPFGVLPQVNADVQIRNLDLAALSATFSFGHMEGRLDGDLSKLRMLGFSPVGFDARLYTTPKDRTRHRISQQAIENIADLGGAGAAAVLSRGLLRFFDDFAYDEIGWSCRLEDEVCSMTGLEPAPNSGFYIVKGKGLPRINVIGYRSRVSWPTLVTKLSNINASGVSRTP